MSPLRAPSAPAWLPIARWSAAESGASASVVFTGLAGWRDLLVAGGDLTTNTGGNDAPALQVSTDDGATWLATNYETYGATLSTRWPVLPATPSSSIMGFRANLIGFNDGARRTLFDAIAGFEGGSTVATRLGHRTPEALSALRVLTLNGASLNAGWLELLGRR